MWVTHVIFSHSHKSEFFSEVYLHQYKRQESITVLSNAHLKFTFVDQVGVHGSPPPPRRGLEFKGGGHKSGLIP